MLASAGCDFLVNQKYKPAPPAKMAEPRKARRGTLPDDVFSVWSDLNIRPLRSSIQFNPFSSNLRLKYAESDSTDVFGAVARVASNPGPYWLHRIALDHRKKGASLLS